MYKTSLPLAAEIGYMTKTGNLGLLAQGAKSILPLVLGGMRQYGGKAIRGTGKFALNRFKNAPRTLNSMVTPLMFLSIGKEVFLPTPEPLTNAANSMARHKEKAMNRYNNRQIVK